MPIRGPLVTPLQMLLLQRAADTRKAVLLYYYGTGSHRKWLSTNHVVESFCSRPFALLGTTTACWLPLNTSSAPSVSLSTP
jgi:hypothetical protein